MPYPKTNQTKTGVVREDSPNKERRTGRDDGTGGGQKKVGTTNEPNAASSRTNRSRPTYDSQGRPLSVDEFDVQTPNHEGEGKVGARPVK